MYQMEKEMAATKYMRGRFNRMLKASETAIRSAIITTRLIRPRRVFIHERATTENVTSRKGTQSATSHSNWKEKAAPATVAVTMAEGSRLDAPVTMPGAIRANPLRGASAESSGPGKRTTRPRFPDDLRCVRSGLGQSTVQ